MLSRQKNLTLTAAAVLLTLETLRGILVQVDLDPQAVLTTDLCRQLISEKIFQLRPDFYGEKYPHWPGSVGLEVEMLPLESHTGITPKSVQLHGSTNSLTNMLKGLAKSNQWTIHSDKSLVSRIEMEQGDNLTFEPGGQLEFSSSPYPCLSDGVRRLKYIQKKLDQNLAQNNWNLVQIGVNPWHKVSELGLQMPKPRYQAMDHYFASLGPYGQRMMRQTCTIQTCVDFGASETEMAKRFLASQLLAPFATAIFTYSPVIEGQFASMLGFRAHIWRNLDPTRTGIPDLNLLQKNLDKSACVETYFDFAMAANVIFVESLNYKVPETPLSFAQWLEHGFEGQSPKLADFENHLSLLFPEVRPRGFLELRSVDAQARIWQVVPAAFYTGLLYAPQKLDAVLDLLLPIANNLPELLSQASFGLSNTQIRENSQKLIQLAWEGFKLLPPCFRGEGTEKSLRVFEELFTSKGRTPADDLMDELQDSKQKTWGTEMLITLEEKWNNKLNS